MNIRASFGSLCSESEKFILYEQITILIKRLIYISNPFGLLGPQEEIRNQNPYGLLGPR